MTQAITILFVLSQIYWNYVNFTRAFYLNTRLVIPSVWNFDLIYIKRWYFIRLLVLRLPLFVHSLFILSAAFVLAWLFHITYINLRPWGRQKQQKISRSLTPKITKKGNEISKIVQIKEVNSAGLIWQILRDIRDPGAGHMSSLPLLIPALGLQCRF